MIKKTEFIDNIHLDNIFVYWLKPFFVKMLRNTLVTNKCKNELVVIILMKNIKGNANNKANIMLRD